MEIYANLKNQAITFQKILEDGKIKSSYNLQQLELSPANVQRHLQDMEKYDEIMIYKQEETGRKTTLYGPTVLGFIDYYPVSEWLQQNIINLFKLWIDEEKFRNDLLKHHFTSDKLENEEKSAEVFKDYVYVEGAIDDAFEEFMDKRIEEIPEEIKQFIGGYELRENLEFGKAIGNIFSYLPGLKDELMSHFKGVKQRNDALMKFFSEL